MTNCVIQHNATFRVYYMKKRSEGQPFKKAVFATAHKIIRVIFAMLTQRTMFKEVCAWMTVIDIWRIHMAMWIVIVNQRNF
jgi:hypothetical protein